MQPGYRPYPQQQQQQLQQQLQQQQRLPPQGHAPRRGGPAPMMAPTGMAHHHLLAPGMPQHAPMQQPQPPQQQPQHHHGGVPMNMQPQPPPHLLQHPQHLQQQQHPQQHLQQPPPHLLHHHAPPAMPMAPGPHLHGGAPMAMVHPQQQQQHQQQLQQHQHPQHHLPSHQMHQHQHQHQQQQQQAAAAAAAAQQAAQQAQNNAIEAAKRRSRRPTDKTIPDGVEDVVVGDGVQRYRELRDFERRLDATMTRKRLDIVDSVQRSGPKRFKTLRIWISNTVENQLWQTGGGVNVDSFDFSTTPEASYRVKIEGRLLEDGDEDADEGGADADKESDQKDEGAADAMDTDGADAPTAAEAGKPKLPRYRFTHFFRAMRADYHAKVPAGAAGMAAENAAAGPKAVEWKRPDRPPPNVPGQPGMAAAAVPEFDELTFKRPGDDNVNMTISLFRYEEPERFELDESLADIVDMKEATRAEAVMGLFEYIRLQNLQEDEEKRNFRCDELLRKLINNDIGYIPLLHDYVNQHIRPLPPVQLLYTVRVDEAFHRNPAPTVYDVRVAVEDPLREQLRPFVQNPQYIGLLRDVGGLDEQLAVLVQAIGMSKSKHEFLSALARDPARFVRQWLSSQKRDLEVIMGESVRGGVGSDLAGEAWRRGGQSSVWVSQNARESVNLLLAKQPLIPRTA